MKASIQWKIVGVYLCVVLAIMVASGSFIISNIEKKQYLNMEEDVERAAGELEILLNLQQDIEVEDNLEELANTLRNVVSLNPYQIYLLDYAGRVQLGTGNLDMNQIVATTVVIEAMRTHKPTTSSWTPFGSRNGRRDLNTSLDHARPVLDRETGEVLMIIYVVADTSQIRENVVDVMATITLGSIMAMGIAVFFSSLFSRMITVPIKQLTTSAKQLAEGSFSRIPIQSTDEIGQLTQSFNYMAAELSRNVADISSEKSKLEKILENMADGVMAFNRQGVLIHANSVCYEMLGNTNMDHRFDYIFPKLGVEVSFDAILAGKAETSDSATMAVADKFFSLHFAPYTNVKGESEGLVVVMQDVTTQQKLDQMRKEFVANVSHELRTPLTTVKSYTETLLDGAIDDREIAVQFLTVMEKETDRMTALVHDLLELSRIDNRQMQLERNLVDIRQVVHDTVEAQEIHADKKGHKLTVHLEEEMDYFILGDNARIRQILHNVLSNAIKYSIDPGQISIRLFKDRNVVIQVQDTGIGIPPKDLERIFERFYRVDKARSRKMGGTGLGLAIAKELIELQGGKIKITSKVGRGTTVTIYFPVYNPSLEGDFV